MSRSVKVILLCAALLVCLSAVAVAGEVITTDHVWGDPVFKSAPTCKSGAIYTKTCKECGETIEYTSGSPDPNAHKYGEWHVTVPPECEKNGTRQRECSLCGATQQESIDAVGHDWSGEWKVTKEPTCTEDGERTQTCGKNPHHTRKEPVAKLGHAYKGTVTTPATCTTPGVMTYVCEHDKSHTYTEVIPAKGHTWDSGKDSPAATCTTPGKKIYTCTVCSATREENIPALGHDYKAAVTTEPTCTTPGVRTYTCTHDSSHTYTEPIPALDHKWDSGTVTKAPTCTATGTRHHVCQRDPSHTKDETIPATGHQHTHWVVTKQPTYTEEGERQKWCDDCGTLLKTEKMSVKMYYNNTICAIGPRLRDVNLSPYNSDNWYMFTPFDASKDGRQTFQLIGSNRYDVGTATIEVRDGTITLNYKVYPVVDVNLEFFTILNQMSDLHEYEPEALSAYAMVPGRAYSIADDFNGDTNLVLYFCSRADYAINRYVTTANLGVPYKNLCRTMLSLMDK